MVSDKVGISSALTPSKSAHEITMAARQGTNRVSLGNESLASASRAYAMAEPKGGARAVQRDIGARASQGVKKLTF